MNKIKSERGSIMIGMGAIMLAVLIISGGLYSYNVNQSAIVKSANTLESQETELYNAPIKAYEGDSISGSQVKLLINTIISQNYQYVGEENKFITLQIVIDGVNADDLESACRSAQMLNDEENVKEAATQMKNISSKISSGKKYKVETSEISGGVITTVRVSDAE